MKELKPCPLDEARKVLWYCAQFTDNTHWAKQYRKALTDICNELDRRAAPENKALTLEQLRQMDGEPVWIVTKRDAGWDIVNVSKEDGSPYLVYFQEYGHYLKENGYGKTWLAYARRPEDTT